MDETAPGDIVNGNSENEASTTESDIKIEDLTEGLSVPAVETVAVETVAVETVVDNSLSISEARASTAERAIGSFVESLIRISGLEVAKPGPERNSVGCDSVSVTAAADSEDPKVLDKSKQSKVQE